MASYDKTANAMGEMMRRMTGYAEDVKNDVCSQIAAKSALKMIGVHEMGPERDDHQVEPMSQAMDKDDFDDPVFLSSLEKVLSLVELSRNGKQKDRH